MPKRTGKASTDMSRTVYRVMREATGQGPKAEEPVNNPGSLAPDGLGGAMSDTARAHNFTREQWSEIGGEGVDKAGGESRLAQ